MFTQFFFPKVAEAELKHFVVGLVIYRVLNGQGYRISTHIFSSFVLIGSVGEESTVLGDGTTFGSDNGHAG